MGKLIKDLILAGAQEDRRRTAADRRMRGANVYFWAGRTAWGAGGRPSRRSRGSQRRTAPSSDSRRASTLFTSSSAAPGKARPSPGTPESYLNGRSESAHEQGFAGAKRLDTLTRGAPRRGSQRRTAPSSDSRRASTLFTSSSASAAVRERSSARRTRLKATLFLPAGMGAPV